MVTNQSQRVGLYTNCIPDCLAEHSHLSSVLSASAPARRLPSGDAREKIWPRFRVGRSGGRSPLQKPGDVLDPHILDRYGFRIFATRIRNFQPPPPPGHRPSLLPPRPPP